MILDDLDLLFDPDEFAVRVATPIGEVLGIPYDGERLRLDRGRQAIEGLPVGLDAPRLLVQAIDAANLNKGDALSFSGQAWELADKPSAGTGLVWLDLSPVSPAPSTNSGWR